MKFLITLYLLVIIIVSGESQRFNQKLYNASSGLVQTECGSPLVLYDSTCIVSEVSNTFHIYDGYKFRPLNYKGMEGCCIMGCYNFKDYSVIVDDDKFQLYKDKTFTLLKGVPQRILNGNNTYYVSRDTFFTLRNAIHYYLLPDSLKFYKTKIDFDSNFYGIKEENVVDYSKSKDNRFVRIGYTSGNRWYDNSLRKQILNKPVFSGIAKNYITTKILNSGFYPGYIFNLFSFDNQTIVEQPQVGNPQFILNYKQDTVEALGIIKQSSGRPYRVNDQLYLQGSHQGFARINPNIHFLQEDENMVASLHTIFEGENNEIYFGSYGNGFSQYKDYKVTKIKRPNSSRVMPGAIKHSNGKMYFLSDLTPQGLNEFLVGGDKATTKQLLPQTGYFLKELSDKSVAMGTFNYSIIIFPDIRTPNVHKVVNEKKGIGSSNVLGIAEDKKGRIWYIGSGVGVYDRTRDTAFHHKKPKEYKHRLNGYSLTCDSYGTMWFGTQTGIHYIKNAEIFNVERNNIQESCTKIDLPNGEESIITFVQQVDNFLVCGSFTSVSFIELNSFYKDASNPIIYQLIYGEDVEGGGSEQNCLLFDSQRKLWIGAQDGALMIEWDKFRFDHTKSKIKVHLLQAGNDTIDVNNSKTTIELPSEKRNLKIEFGLDKNISLLKNVFFDYTLISSNNDTLENSRYDQNGELDIKYLPPGKYSLHIIAKKHGQVMDELIINIHARRSLAESPIFWGCLFLSLLLASVGFIWYRNSARNEVLQKELKLSQLISEKDQLKVQSIISSFNPHFINNSLHWIQSRHLDDADTVNLVGDLSENIRYIFETTKNGKAVHLLKYEMKLVNNYVNVQLLRFGNSFKFIQPDFQEISKYETFILIIMQLQIHIENAIEHGLRNRKKSSFVKLNIIEHVENLCFIIEDDGGGREKAKEIGSTGTQRGTRMLMELYELFNTFNIEKITTTYEDNIFFTDGEYYGTRVIIKIPKNYTYQINN